MRRAQPLGRYPLLDRIAFSGMAEICRAETFDGNSQPHLIAVKRVLTHLAEDDAFLQMLVDEARIASVHAGEVKLCDFGIAKAMLSRITTRTGVIRGKVKYMSPAQTLGRKLDHRSNVFSLGSCM